MYNNKGEELERASFRCPIKGEINPWVNKNVLPEMTAIKETHSSYDEMLADIGKWWMSHKEDAITMWHMGHVVEAYLFRELVRVQSIGEWDAPYTPIEVSEILRVSGYSADSVDGYLEDHNLPKPNVEGGTHNPLYDAAVAATVYFDLMLK